MPRVRLWAGWAPAVGFGSGCWRRASHGVNRSRPTLCALVAPLFWQLEALAADRVAIVRLALAHLVRQQLVEGDAYKALRETITMRDKLLQDVDRDVRAATPDVRAATPPCRHAPHRRARPGGDCPRPLGQPRPQRL